MTHDFCNGRVDLLGAHALALLVRLGLPLTSRAVGEIDGSTQEGSQIADRVLGATEMIPTGFHDV
ncbi:hypothetical protein BG58_25035 [Caballeronia jiangsuensis]|nr:hypothetical protein BG58_25035 [Caballeronia jiangsuensis]